MKNLGAEGCWKAPKDPFGILSVMNGWAFAGFVVVVTITWMASTICYAPLGVEDEHGFRVVEPSRSLRNLVDPHQVRVPTWHLSVVSLIPLWPV